jgi:hypothetical protein
MSPPNAAEMHGTPGDRARLAGLLCALWPLLAALFLAGVVLGLLLPLRPVSTAGAGFVLVALAMVLSVTLSLCPSRVAAYFKGARGEERVAAILAALPAGFHVFHGLDAGGRRRLFPRGDIDHAVVGPAGVFAIETKCWQGRTTCRNGQVRLDGRLPRRDPVAQARQSAGRLADCLAAGLERAPDVRPVVCFAGRGLEDGPCRCDEVALCDAGSLLKEVTAPGPSTLTAAEVEAAAALFGRLVLGAP